MVPTLFATGVPAEGSLGKGKLIDIISAEVFEEINGEYYLTFKYPVTGALYADLVEGGVVAAAHPLAWVGKWRYRSQWFDIVSHTAEIDGVVEFRAEHCSRRLSKVFDLGPASLTSPYAATWIWNYFTELTTSYPRTVDGMQFFGTGSGTIPSPIDYKIVPLKSVLAALIGSEDSKATVFGHEFGFDCSFYPYGQSIHTPGTVTAIEYYQGRGKDRGVSIRRGVNMLGLEHTIDKANTFNAVLPYWDKKDGSYKTAWNGAMTDLIVQPTVPISPVIVAGLDCTDAFESEPTQAQLVQYAQEWLDANQPWLPIDSLSVDFANDIIEGNDEIYIGDTLHVYWPDADISAKMRVHSYKYDVLAEKYTALNLGTPQTEYVAVTGDTYAGANGGGSSGGSDGYKPGDTLTLGAVIVSDGIITASTRVVRFMIVTPKSMAGITNITATNMSVELRGANGYLNSQSGFYDFANRSGYTVTCAKATDNLITVNITKSSAFTNVSNNTLVSANLDTTVAFEFS